MASMAITPVQICFAGNANLENVKKQINELKEHGGYVFYHCFLPRHIVEEKGFSTEIVDILESLGDKNVCALKDCETFEEAMATLPQKRIDVANTVMKMFVLDSGTATGVQEEIKLFTNQKVILMP